MKQINYNEISRVYDDVRKADAALLNSMLQELDWRKEMRILDIGCGTGNYLALLRRATQVQAHGIEPSAGMIQKARAKNPDITFQQGDAAHIPHADAFFDFVYMTDVIHHVPDIRAMFTEIRRVLRLQGKLCIATQSHAQIAARPIATFFPGTIRVDQARYPDIDAIVGAAEAGGFTFLKTIVLEAGEAIAINEAFLELARKKGYSMLHLIADEEYEQGLQDLREALTQGAFTLPAAGESLVWFCKP